MRSREEVNKIIAKAHVAKKRLQAAKNAGTPESELASVVEGKDKESMENEIVKGEQYANEQMKPDKKKYEEAMAALLKKGK